MILNPCATLKDILANTFAQVIIIFFFVENFLLGFFLLCYTLWGRKHPPIEQNKDLPVHREAEAIARAAWGKD